MPYTDPTATEVKARFPEFASLTDPVVEQAIVEAKFHVDNTWPETVYTTALLYRTAHQLSVDGYGKTGQVSTLGLDGLTSFTIKDLSVQRSAKLAETEGALDASSTKYGRRFIELRNRYFGGGVIV